MPSETFYLSSVTSIGGNGRLSVVPNEQSRWSYEVSEKNAAELTGFDKTSECAWCGDCDWEETKYSFINVVQCRHCGFSPQEAQESIELEEPPIPTTPINLSSQYADLISFDKEASGISPPNSPSSIGSVNERDFLVQEEAVILTVVREPDVKLIDDHRSEPSTTPEPVVGQRNLSLDLRPTITDFSSEPTVLEIVSRLSRVDLDEEEDLDPEHIAKPSSPKYMPGPSTYEDEKYDEDSVAGPSHYDYMGGPSSASGSSTRPTLESWQIFGVSDIENALDAIPEAEAGPSSQRFHLNNPYTNIQRDLPILEGNHNHGDSRANDDSDTHESSHVHESSHNAESSHTAESSQTNGKSATQEEEDQIKSILQTRTIAISEPAATTVASSSSSNNNNLEEQQSQPKKKSNREWYHSAENATFQFKITPRGQAAAGSQTVSLAELSRDPTAMQRLLACALFVMKDVPDKEAPAKVLDLGLASAREAGANHFDMKHERKAQVEVETPAERARRLLWKVSFQQH